MRVLTRSLPEGTLPIPDVAVDSNVLWFGFALTIATGLLFGLAPAWRIATAKTNDTLKEGGRGSTGGIRSWLRDSLAAGEVALAAILLIGAGLLMQSLANLQRVRLGFDSSGLMTFQLAPPVPQYPLADQGARLSITRSSRTCNRFPVCAVRPSAAEFPSAPEITPGIQ